MLGKYWSHPSSRRFNRGKKAETKRLQLFSVMNGLGENFFGPGSRSFAAGTALKVNTTLSPETPAKGCNTHYLKSGPLHPSQKPSSSEEGNRLSIEREEVFPENPSGKESTIVHRRCNAPDKRGRT